MCRCICRPMEALRTRECPAHPSPTPLTIERGPERRTKEQLKAMMVSEHV